MDSSLLISAAGLGVTNHVYFHRYEPRNANVPFIFLAVQPIALLLILGGNLSSARLMWSYAVFLVSLSLSIIAGYRYLHHKKLHDTYGPYVRTGPNEISVADAAAVSEILNFGGLDKGRFYEVGRHSSTPPTIVSLVGEEHAVKRRAWNRSMTSAALREYDPLVAKRASQLVSRLEEQNGIVDLVSWIDLFVLDLMGDLAFGGAFEFLREGKDVASVGTRIRSYMTASSISGQIPWIISTLHLFPQVGRIIQEFNDFGQGLALQRIKNGGLGTQDLWYHLADEAGLEKEKPTLESSAADGIVAVIAASDTTASVLSSLVWFLLSDPECYRRVQLELDSVFVDGDDPLDVSKHPQLEFLSACINETMRLHPPVATNGTRQVNPNTTGRHIAGRFIPPGTSIYTPSYSIHRSPAYFTHPDQFIPDRWLPGATFPEHEPSAFIPFSLGPANCAGQKFAKRELLTVVSLLLKTFHLRFADGFDNDKWPEHIHDFFVATRGPLRVNLTPR